MSDRSQHAYITSSGSFLPGPPVPNDVMEDRLGLVGGKPSRYRESILSANGIRSRHYAIDEAGNQTHLNQDLAALAISDALERRGMPASELEMLSIGTTCGDLIMPGFGSMVHGRLAEDHPDLGAVEVLSVAGICASGASAMRHAVNTVRLGDHRRVVSAASENPSVMMKASRFEEESRLALERDDVATAFEYFNADFLRWMLSDGAGAVVIEDRPHPTELSLRVDWIDVNSYAHAFPTCMFWGTSDPRNITPGHTWLGEPTAGDAEREGMMVIRQDTRLLAESLLPMGLTELRRLEDSGRLDPVAGYDWFLPHLSSYFFKDFLSGGLAELGLDLPEERWFTNLSTAGNTGSASIYVMLDEALRKGLFKEGDRILGFVPESGRFSISFMQFTCVAPD